MSKLKLDNHQEELFTTLINWNRKNNAYIISTMRSGKTAVFIKYINYLFTKCTDCFNYKILWIAYDSSERDEDLKNEFIKWGYENIYSNIDVILIDSLHKIDIAKYNLIIYNEFQTITEKVYNTLKEANLILGLTGTFPYDNSEKVNLLTKLNFNDNSKLYELLLDGAVELDIISNYKIFLEPLNIASNNLFINVKQSNKKEYTISEEKRIKLYNNQLNQIDAETYQITKKRELIQKEINSFKEYKLESEENKIKLRKLYEINKNYINFLKPYWELKKNISLYFQKTLNTLPSKVIYAKDYLRNFPNERIIILASDSESSNLISSHVYNSKTSDDFLKKFCNFETNHIVLVNKKATGGTFKKINTVILLAISSSSVSVLQKIARGMMNDTKLLKVYIPYVKDTPELNWIKKALNSLNQNNIIINT